MHRFSAFLLVVILLSVSATVWAAMAPFDPTQMRGPVRPEPNVAQPNTMNRVHNAGKLAMNITNYGYFGNDAASNNGMKDPCPPKAWAPQLEYPKGSHQEYLFQGGMWIGALIVEQGFETKRVSTGLDGWLQVNELYPGEGDANGIHERSTRPGLTNCLGEYVSSPDAVSDQDFICSYTDTLTASSYVTRDPIDGAHRPLGVKITQKSYAFSQAFAEDFVLIDYEVENIAHNFLRNLYVGLYVDADVGRQEDQNRHTDDICGFTQYTYETNPATGRTDSIPIDVAWIADNDGRDAGVTSGPPTCPHVVGTRVIRGPNPRLKTSFNWWISNGDVALDFGPAWEDYCARDSMGMGWTRTLGTPMGDEHKYQVLSNGEFDYWQVSVGHTPYTPQRLADGSLKAWCTSDPSPSAADIANGYDTRYLLSWGPLGIRDYQDATGRWIYRLNPGEKFFMTVAMVMGENFHNPTRMQPNPDVIDSSLFDFTDLRLNARWAKDVYDNPMFDTPIYDWGNDHNENTIDADHSQGDGILDTGDGWYGEDVGSDGLFAELPVGVDSVPVYYFKGSEYERFVGWYKGPDADGSERNGRIDSITSGIYAGLTEDMIIPETMVLHHLPHYGDWDMGWMSHNGLMDQGDGIPDFTGPPPPPIPALLHVVPNTYNAASHVGGIVRHGEYVGGLGYELREDSVILRWSKKSSEDSTYRDPFSRLQDFEGYRILVSNVNEDQYFSLLAEYDKVDFAYFSGTDSLMSVPVSEDSARRMPQETTIRGVHALLKKVGNNTGFGELTMNDSTYQFVVKAHKLAPQYYSVVAFDYGDPKSGLGPLATRPTANAVLLAPAGSKKEKVRVVPNPYRAYSDYTQQFGGVSWENQNDGTTQYYPQQDRRIEFINLPDECLIRIYTVAGDVVQIIPHNVTGDRSTWASLNSERWDLNSRNRQQVTSGIYLFSVEDMTPGHGYQIETGKFVIIR